MRCLENWGLTKQYQEYSCPLCGGDITEDQDDINLEEIVNSNNAEISKIDSHLSDLKDTQKSVTGSIEYNKRELALVLEGIAEKDLLLTSAIGGKVKESRLILKELDSAKANFRKQRDEEQKRREVFEEIGRLQSQLDQIEYEYELPEFSTEILNLVKEISKILTRWDFPNADLVTFDTDTKDIVIDGKPRSHYGKGYRAICFSSILLGLMEYLVPQERHPGFVILDSPLTTYKKQDEVVEGQDQEVFLANNLIYAFYRDLSDFYNDKQIIVLDNQEPDKDLHSLMNYVHFSGNADVGRYGFFPVS